MTVEVTGVNGEKFDLRLAVAVFEVSDNGEAPDSERFDVRVNVSMDVKRKTP